MNSRIEATYDYTDPNGKLLFRVVRYYPKGFRQQRPDGKGGWIWNVEGVPKVLFELPQVVAAAQQGKTVFLVEGEKDAANLGRWGLVATCNPGGAGKWSEAYTDALAGANVVLLPDNDPAGVSHAAAVAMSLHARGIPVKVLHLPNLLEKEDVSDWIGQGGTREQLEALAQAAEIWQPPQNEVADGVRDVEAAVANFYWVTIGEKRARVALPLTTISQEVSQLTGGWPKRVAGQLFVDENGSIRFLDSAESLFAWLGEGCAIQWATGTDVDGRQLTPKGELFAHFCAKANAYRSIEELPHEPWMPDAYYAWRTPDSCGADGSYLTQLLGFFDNVSSEVDKALLLSLFLTPAWGGLPGKRPAFIITAPDRGFGKTTIADVVGRIFGMIDIRANERDESRIMPRLLSNTALAKRVLRLDNVKVGLSNDMIESLITSSEISGHKLYVGEGCRPNLLTTIITGNGLRLSRDLADRAFVIVLEKPKFRPHWTERVFEFAEKNKDRILADILLVLRQTPAVHEARDRWQSWVDNVLARCTNQVETVVHVNQQRRNAHDEELEEAQIIDEALKSTLDSHRVASQEFISTSEVCTVLQRTLNKPHLSLKGAAMTMQRHIDAGRLSDWEPERTSSARGYRRKFQRHDERDGYDASSYAIPADQDELPF